MAKPISRYPMILMRRTGPAAIQVYDHVFLVRNSISSALNEKVKQLKKSGFNGARGIILCDGDCDLLHSKSISASGFELKDVLRAFFEGDPRVPQLRPRRPRNTSISFIAIMFVEDTGTTGWDRNRKLTCQVFRNPWATYPVTQEDMQMVLSEIDK